ncbi:hypothetical protein [Legionella erythra]|uniref:Uncharacterized protein n=1 Tax=Legionella erythra TaxID=448 RepID=A0A0W0TSI3_LEGER|nr:hypothetical protein [Legionella erythra]KTC98362.1 hypothetical protein Lery_0925 [Legionella erythra]
MPGVVSSLITDALIIRGVTVMDILNKPSLRAHQRTAFARVNKTHGPTNFTTQAEPIEVYTMNKKNWTDRL